MVAKLTFTRFGKYRVQRRRDTERTIALMAEALGVDTAYVSAVERGEIVPPECYIEKVAAYFGDKIEYLKAKALDLAPTIETTYKVTERREIQWPQNVVSYAEFQKRRWPTISTSPTD